MTLNFTGESSHSNLFSSSSSKFEHLGNAITVYAIVPLWAVSSNFDIPTYLNLTYLLDGAARGGVHTNISMLPTHPGNTDSTPAPNGNAVVGSNASSPSAPSTNGAGTSTQVLGNETFAYNVSVFAASGLADTLHSLVISVGDDSTFIFDYAVVALGDAPAPASTGGPNTGTIDANR